MKMKTKTISIFDLRSNECYDLLMQLNPFEPKEEGGVTYLPSNLTEKERWNVVKKLDRKVVNFNGIKVV
jgi:hypothetical protein